MDQGPLTGRSGWRAAVMPGLQQRSGDRFHAWNRAQPCPTCI